MVGELGGGGLIDIINGVVWGGEEFQGEMIEACSDFGKKRFEY